MRYPQVTLCFDVVSHKHLVSVDRSAFVKRTIRLIRIAESRLSASRRAYLLCSLQILGAPGVRLLEALHTNYLGDDEFGHIDKYNMIATPEYGFDRDIQIRLEYDSLRFQ